MRFSPRTLRWSVGVLSLSLIGLVWVAELPRVTLRFVYSPDAEGVLAPMIARFNAEHLFVTIEGESGSSGAELRKIVDGEDRPDLWMPASQIWVKLLNLDMGEQVTLPEPPSYFWSPELIATWKHVKEALGGQVGFQDLAALAADDNLLGGAEFRLGHTRPTTSTSGLFAVVSEYEAALGGRALDPQAMREPEVTAAVRAVEATVRHYDDIAGDFCEPLSSFTSTYVTAVYLQETTLEKCLAAAEGLDELVGVVPPGGTYIADYPLVRFAWSTDGARAAAAREAAAVFERWLAEHLDPDAIGAQHLHVGDPWDPATANDDPPPDLRRQHPDAVVLKAAQDGWHEARKPGHVLLVLDRSAGMSEQGHDVAARNLLREILGQLPTRDQDQVGFMTFGVEVSLVQPLAPVADVRDELKEDIEAARPTESTSAVLYDALWEVTQLPALLDQTAIDLVVIVSLGVDVGSAQRRESLIRRIELRRSAPSALQIVTVSSDDPGSGELLGEIADASYSPTYVLTNAEDGPTSAADIAKAIAKLV